jgi:ribosomal protein S18 acetylase RimI-like enzyme
MAPLINGVGIGELRSISGNPPTEFLPSSVAAKVHIRPYVEGDRPAIRRLCWETGFLGNPIDPVFQDRELFADLFTAAYLEHEPEWALVAELDHRIVGYLLGSISSHFDFVLMRKGFPIAAKMVFRLLTGRYVGHPRSARFVRWLLTVGYQEQPKHPPNAAHFHFDLENRIRGLGIAQRLWHVYEQRLRRAGVNECYGAFFSCPGRRPELVYKRYGFQVFDRKRTSLFQPEVAGAELVCMHRKL